MMTEPDARHFLLVVDQFEELLTLASEDTRPQFQQMLLSLAEEPDYYVILTVRADICPNLMESHLWSQIQ